MTVFTEGPKESPGYLMWRVMLRWQRAVTAALRPLGLTHAQFVLLASTWWLCRNDRRPNQLAVATHADTNIKMTSEILRKLEDKGLVELHTDPDDRRARIVLVTPAGSGLAQRAVAVVERVDREFFAPAPPSLVPALQSLVELPPSASEA